MSQVWIKEIHNKYVHRYIKTELCDVIDDQFFTEQEFRESDLHSCYVIDNAMLTETLHNVVDKVNKKSPSDKFVECDELQEILDTIKEMNDFYISVELRNALSKFLSDNQLKRIKTRVYVTDKIRKEPTIGDKELVSMVKYVFEVYFNNKHGISCSFNNIHDNGYINTNRRNFMKFVVKMITLQELIELIEKSHWYKDQLTPTNLQRLTDVYNNCDLIKPNPSPKD